MVVLHRCYPISIKALEENGYGVGMVQGERVYVNQALPQEAGTVRIVKKRKDGYVGEMVRWKHQNANRVKSPCAIYDRCGSCHLLHCRYEAQLALKKEQLQRWVKQASLSLRVHDVVGMEVPYAYRNKVIIGFERDRRGRIRAGFYEEFSHRIIPYQRCLLHDEEMDRIVGTMVHLMEKQRIEPYEEARRKGLLRHVILRRSSLNGDVMVILVVNAMVFPGCHHFVSALRQAHPAIRTVVMNVNTRHTSVVLGERGRVVYGNGWIEDELCGYRYRISAKSFFQINHAQCEVLYGKALSLLKLSGNETVLDTYCGIGTIGMSVADRVKQVIGVENNRDAVQDATMNAKRNQVKNIRFVCADAGEYMRKAAQRGDIVDVIIMDPPRSGSTKAFMDACAKLKVAQILYISCDPRTQLRDLAYFRRLGYVAKEMYPVDMFAHTGHVETVVLMSRVEGK